MNPDLQKLQANVCRMLEQAEVQEHLAHLLVTYFTTVQPIVHAATIQNSGIRPDCLENEIYSCFHHIARGLCSGTTSAESINEIQKGTNTHLKRLLLDSYKIAIRPQLEEYRFIVEELYSLSLDKDFNPDVFGAEPIKKVQQILAIKTKIKASYQEAKRYEALGNLEEAVNAYDATLSDCYALCIAINALMKEDVFVVAKAHVARKLEEKKQAEAQRLREREEDNKRHKRSAMISNIIATCAVCVAAAAWLYPREQVPPSNNNPAPIVPTENYIPPHSQPSIEKLPPTAQ